MSSAQINKSYLIIGQGIAGSLLAWNLIKAGHQVTIIDDNHHSSSSIISAGIINPITGQRLVLTPDYNLYFNHAIKTYTQLSAQLGLDVFIPKPIIRVLRSSEELLRCQHLNTTAAAQPYIEGIHKSGHYGAGLLDPFGSLTITQGGHVQTSALLTALKEYFLSKKMLINEHFAYSDLTVSDDQVQWQSQRFNAAIFCEGFKSQENPWFKNLPFNLAKGEILKIAFESASFLPDAILCQQQWCLPSQSGTYLAGSTYDRDNINTTPTPEGQSTILQGLNKFIPSKARVIESYAAVRPIMLDGKPRIVMHPSLPIGIFNGFASKGMLWAPYYAENFANEIINN